MRLAPNETPFQPGEAVLFVVPTGRVGVWHFEPARVVRLGGARISVEMAKGRRSVRACGVLHGAWCPSCALPGRLEALEGTPVCPRCARACEPLPPPVDVVARWWQPTGLAPERWPLLYSAIARGLAEGRTEDEARTAYYAWRDANYPREWAEPAAPVEPPSRERLLAAREWLVNMLALVEDELADRDGTGLAVELPPAWCPPADDAQPDGGDDLTEWLRRQMGGA